MRLLDGAGSVITKDLITEFLDDVVEEERTRAGAVVGTSKECFDILAFEVG